jgi:hypothetical protein
VILAIPQALSLSRTWPLRDGSPTLAPWLHSLQAALLALLAYAVVRLWLHIRQLKSDPGLR